VVKVHEEEENNNLEAGDTENEDEERGE